MESISKTPIEHRVIAICEPTLRTFGFGLVDVDCRLGRRSLLRLFIEPILPVQPGGGTSIEDCVRVNSLIGPLLERENPFPGSYDLEVSSPGIERRLRLRPDFEKAIGSKVQLTFCSTDKSTRITGSLVRLNGDDLVMSTESGQIQVPISQVSRAIKKRAEGD